MIDPTDYFPAESSKGAGEKSTRLSSDFVFNRILIMRMSGHLPDSRCAWIISLRYQICLSPGKTGYVDPDGTLNW
jgi:hypothetical protein